jgi:hypothetical protein
MNAPQASLYALRAPDFGTGATRRRIRLVATDGHCHARLVDPFHEMSVDLRHDGAVVTAIEGRFLRNPNSTCPGAARLLDELLGLDLRTPAAAVYAGGRSRRHCTHLLDLAVLALAQAARGEGRRQYDAVVPDETDAPIDIEVRRDAATVFAWQVQRGHILAPAEFAGLPLGPGFTAWSTARLAGDALEAAQVLSRTWYISRGREYDIQIWAGQPVSRHDVLLDRCYSYAAERAEHGVFLADVRRDFSRGMPDDL